ncbi:MAG: transposase [Luteimonas sp.]
MSKRRTFSEEFKREAVELTGQPGVTISQVGRDIGVGAGLLGRWRREMILPLNLGHSSKNLFKIF